MGHMPYATRHSIWVIISYGTWPVITACGVWRVGYSIRAFVADDRADAHGLDTEVRPEELLQCRLRQSSQPCRKGRNAWDIGHKTEDRDCEP